ncbi:MAG: right-handed parallel beta-helix repeat-containing protein [Anaerolineales bacterium]|nr:right-handed parallel beta-helix repeat-containing protein [Anaerolineales bacterium]
MTFFTILACLPLVLASCGAVEELGENTLTTQGQEESVFIQPTVVQPINTPPSNPPLTDTEEVEYPPISRYVSPHGSDENDGSSRKQAHASVKQALESAQAGDVVLISEGVYSEGIELEELIGPIIIIGEGDVVLDGERNIRIGIWCENCANITFDNLTFRNYTDVGIGVYLGDQIVMRNLTVHNNGFAVQLVGWDFEGYGIMVDESSNVLVENNVVYENGPKPQIFPDFLMGTGINIYGCTHCQMMYNQVYNNTGGTLVEDSVDVLVEGNEIWGNDLDASADGWWDGGLWIDGGHDITARNNIFHNNLGPGIEVSNEDNQEVYGYVLENNISTGNYFGIYVWNFGTNDFPDERILKMVGNTFENNSYRDIMITDWECPPDDPCD